MEDGLLGFPEERRPLTEYPSGYEIGYTANTGGDINVLSTNSAAPTIILTTPFMFFDGGFVMAHFFAGEIETPTNAVDSGVITSLYEGSSPIVCISRQNTQNTGSGRGNNPTGFYRFKPSAGSHQYTIRAYAFSLTGTPSFRGNVDPTVFAPVFIRFTKV